MKNDYDAPEGETFDEIYQSDGLRWMSVIVVLLVVFGFFSLAWYAYRTNTGPTVGEGEVFVVEGDTAPYKERPEEPGGMVFPHQDKEVYNRLVAADEQAADKPVERLLPPPENPLTERRPAASEENAEKATSWINTRIHPDAVPEQQKTEVIEAAPASVPETDPAPAPAEQKESEANAPEASPAPVEKKSEPEQKKSEAAKSDVRKEEVKAREDVPAYVAPNPVVKPWVPVENAQEKKAEDKPAPAQQQIAAPVDPIVAQAEKFTQEKQPAPPAPPAAPEPQATKPPAPAPVVAGGSVDVQLAALRSRAEAETVWKGLSARHRDVLGGKSYRIVEADIPGKGMYYRLRVGVSSAAAAKSLCATLTQRNQACILVR